MNKTVWARPNARIDEFAANEYVAACDGSTWGVACNNTAADAYEKTINNWWDPAKSGYEISTLVNHTDTAGNSHCGLVTSQHINYNSSGVAVSMYEVDAAGQESLECTVYTSQEYKTKATMSDIEPGMTIYWTTTDSGRTWHHVGTVYGHTNRS